MADIVQLVENGQKKYIKTHVEAVEGLTKGVEDIIGGIDSGARAISLAGGATAVTNFPISYRKRLGIVRWEGRIKLPTTAYGVAIEIGSIPVEYAPKQETPIILFPIDSSVDKKAIVIFQTSGKVILHFSNLSANYSFNNIVWDAF